MSTRRYVRKSKKAINSKEIDYDATHLSLGLSNSLAFPIRAAKLSKFWVGVKKINKRMIFVTLMKGIVVKNDGPLITLVFLMHVIADLIHNMFTLVIIRTLNQTLKRQRGMHK